MRSLLKLLVLHNPFYLLSALCMLIGCYTLNHSLGLRPGEASRLLVLFITLNVYEALLIALALLLVRRATVLDDGRTLLLLELLFLADGTFLVAEFFSIDLAVGTAVALVALAQAALKLLAISRTLGAGFPPAYRLALVELAVLFAIPGLFAGLAELRWLDMSAAYSLWWVLALLVVTRAMLERAFTRERAATPSASVELPFRAALGVAPGAAVALHLCGAGWVYQVPFSVAYLGPVLIALGTRLLLTHARGREPVWGWRLPLLGIGLSWIYPPSLEVAGPGGLVLSPFRLALVAAGVTFLLGFQLYRERRQLVAALSCLIGAALGHSLEAMAGSLGDLVRVLVAWPRRLAPRGAREWGVVAVGSAFVLLAVGGWVSLLKGRLRSAAVPAKR